MGGLLGGLLGALQAALTFINTTLTYMLDSAITAEYVSLSTFPHYDYRIVCGGGVRSGKGVGFSHLSPSVVFLGSDSAYYTVSGSGYRDGRAPYIPMVSGASNVALSTWVGSTITSCGGGGTSVGGTQWYSRVKFKCVATSGIYMPPLSLYDFTMIGADGGNSEGPRNTSQLLSAIISTGMILGPTSIWLLSTIVMRMVMSQITQNRDFDLAMTAAGLQEYIRVE